MRPMNVNIDPAAYNQTLLSGCCLNANCNDAFSRINYNGIQDLIQLSKFSSQTFLVNKICLEIKFLSLKIYVLEFFIGKSPVWHFMRM